MSQIFLSYARHDDAHPPDMPKAKGFVSFLHEQLLYELRGLGEPLPHIWRDTRQIEPAHQFDPLIQGAINDSSILVVVLSRNWLFRPYCLSELEGFKQRWSAEGDTSVRKRIVVVSKHYIASKDRPELLQGQEGYEFFSGDAGRENEYFARGEIRDPNYTDRVRQLASYLWRTTAQMSAAPGTPVPVPKVKATIATAPSSSVATGRTVYLGKPSADMRQGYFRIVEELQGRGYGVVPNAKDEIPIDAEAIGFVDAALDKAELSIHLLGEKAGYKPEDADPIVKLQLARAAARVESPEQDGANAKRRFRRIIWAPKVLEADAESAKQGTGRDPLMVLAKFDRQLATDKVEGDNLSKFVDFLIHDLESNSIKSETLEELEPEGSVYVYHLPEDQRYAFSLAKALHERALEPMLPALEGDAAQRNILHRQNLMDCDAVVLCWAAASEVWAKATARELKSWRDLGRTKKFACRGLVAGPPPGIRKLAFINLPPRSEIDLVLDLTGLSEPSPEALEPLIRGSKPHAP